MAALVHDDLLEAVAIVAEPDQVAARIQHRFGTVLDRVALNAALRHGRRRLAADRRGPAELGQPISPSCFSPMGSPPRQRSLVRPRRHCGRVGCGQTRTS